MRGTPSVATGMEAVEAEFVIGNPVMLGQGRTCANGKGGEPSYRSDTPGHPARGRYVIAAGLLAHGSAPASGLPAACAAVAVMD
ncbi:hypothetical protein HNQ36_000752 [Afipia massiliensis]|uniref:Uncharacterized protein n=1 Tax=Afipia massiliensis TaxID=211460 RepID=A0A840MWI2_9BRAD|nr:hypothetical protein [Afipia massiliensis]